MKNFPMPPGQYWKKIVLSGIRDSHDSETRRKIFLFNVFCHVSIISLIALGIVAFLQGAPFLGCADITMALIVFALVVYLHNSGNQVFCSRAAAILANLFFCYLFATGGVNSTAFMWLYTYPLLVFFMLSLIEGCLATLFLFLFASAFLIVDLTSQSISVYDTDFALRFIPSFLVVFFFSFLLERSRTHAHEALIQKQDALTLLVDKLKKKEKQLEMAQNKLEHRVAERTSELLDINEQLKTEIEVRKKAERERNRLENELSRAQKMEVLGRLAGGVAHDLNNVLSGLVSYPDFLMIDLPADSPLRDSLEIIKKSGEKAAAIVQDLLALARRGVMVKETISINNVLGEYFQSPEYLKLCRLNPAVTVKKHLNNHLQMVEGSSIHLQNAIMNLIINAFETIEKVGQVTVSTENIILGNSAKGYEVIPKGSYAVLKIEDDGAGMSPDIIEKIFEPFFSRKKMGCSGTGLGMTVVWGTIKDHGGFLDIKSKPGQGTTLSLFFPVSSKPVFNGQRETSDIKQLAQGYGERILIVDDVKEQREIGASILEKLGYRAEAVSSGEEAINFIKNQSVDLILLDMIMPPGLDGLETYRKILEVNPGQKAVIVSGFSENERVREALELGIGAYLQKPYSMEQVSRVLKAELTK